MPYYSFSPSVRATCRPHPVLRPTASSLIRRSTMTMMWCAAVLIVAGTAVASAAVLPATNNNNNKIGRQAHTLRGHSLFRPFPSLLSPPSQLRTTMTAADPRHENVHGLQQQDGATTNNNDCLSPIGDILRSGQQDEDGFGYDVSISQNGQFVAVGGDFYSGVAGTWTGLVQVYEKTNVNNNNNNNNGHQWIQRGNNIEGEKAGDELFANALSNDGNILAVGAYLNDDNGSQSGHVRVYQFNIALGDWQQLGDTLVGLDALDRFGWSVALSGDGTILAVGAYYGGGPNDEGQALVFFWNGSAWVNQGDPINGQNIGDRFGISIALTEDGNILAVGAYWYDDNGKQDSGSVQVFEFTNSSWNQLGQELYGDNANDYFGYSVSLSSDGHTMAVGANLADSNGVSSSGQAQVYHFNDNDRQWAQHGTSLTGNAVSDYFGSSVSLSGDGLILAVGAPQDSGGKGFLRVFRWDDGQEDWQPFGNDLVGTTADDDLGEAVAVARAGSTVVVGGDAAYTGHPGLAMVVQLDATCQMTSPTMSPTTMSPTANPTMSPTISPTMSPTPSPMVSPTAGPTTSPMMGSTVSPSVGPVTPRPTMASPTLAPTIAPTSFTPSLHPTSMNSALGPIESSQAPSFEELTGTEVDGTITGITMDFVGVGELTPGEILDFESVTKVWYEAYYDSLERSRPDSVQVHDLKTSILVTDQGVNTVERTNTIQYDQTLVYIALDSYLSARDIVLRPFLDAQAKADYAARLQTIGAFQDVEIPIPNPDVPVQNKEVDPQGLPTGVLIGAVVGSLAFVAACLVFVLVFRGYRKRHQQEDNSHHSNDGNDNPQNNDGDDSEDISLHHDQDHQHQITTPPPPPRIQSAVAVLQPDAAGPQPNIVPFPLTNKDQCRNAGPEARQNPPLVAVKPTPTHNTTGPPLPGFKDQVQSVNPPSGQQPPMAPNARLVPDEPWQHNVHIGLDP